ncbi:5'-nucleotidase C-terminal domain-containing protein [Bacillus pumilus]|nr:5'-nucleotidase C-terminal domain-containing protein [Bacillus pumilus]
MRKGGGIGGRIEKGEMSLGDILRVMGLGNRVYVGDLKGSEIKKGVEEGV